MVRTFLSIALAASIVGSSGCAKEPTAGQRKTSFTIGVIPKGLTHEFWVSIHAGALEAAQEYRAEGIAVEIDWQGPPKESDREKQIQIVQSELGKGVDAIVLAPVDKTALVGPVLHAKRKGIPVVIFDSGLDADPENYVTFVATDNFEGGRKAGLHLAERIAARKKEDPSFEPKIILLRYAPGHDSTSQREAGFLEAMEETGLAGALLSSDQYGGETRESAQQKAEVLLTQFKDQVNAVFAPNESSTYGLLQAVKRMGLAGKLLFVGFDSSESLVAALKAEEIQGLVLQNPVKMGYLGVKYAIEHLRGGEAPPKKVDTGSTVATPENMETPEIRGLLSPDLSILKR